MSGHQEYKCPGCGFEWESLGQPICPRCSPFAAPSGSASWSKTPPTGPGYSQALPSASVRVKTGDVVRFRSGGRHKHGIVMQVTANHLLVYSKRNGGMHSVRPEDVKRIL